MNVFWPIWIKASIATHFRTRRQGYSMLIEGEQRPATESNNRFEVRVDGPDITFGTKNWYRLRVIINTLLTSVSNDANIYKMDTLKGVILRSYTTSIPVYKYGDDGSILGCLTLKSQVDMSDIGLRDNELRQSFISAVYKMDLIYSGMTVEENLTLNAIVTQTGA